MQKIRSIVSAALVAASLSDSQLFVQAELGQPIKSVTEPRKYMAPSVEFQMFELDGKVDDIIWCGETNDVMLVKSSDGSIYRSRDRGGNWKRLKGMMSK